MAFPHYTTMSTSLPKLPADFIDALIGAGQDVCAHGMRIEAEPLFGFHPEFRIACDIDEATVLTIIKFDGDVQHSAYPPRLIRAHLAAKINQQYATNENVIRSAT